jgi:hypothetical protein
MADDRTRLQALSLINDCHKYIMHLTTKSVVVTHADIDIDIDIEGETNYI